MTLVNELGGSVNDALLSEVKTQQQYFLVYVISHFFFCQHFHTGGTNVRRPRRSPVPTASCCMVWNGVCTSYGFSGLA